MRNNNTDIFLVALTGFIIGAALMALPTAALLEDLNTLRAATIEAGCGGYNTTTGEFEVNAQR